MHSEVRSFADIQQHAGAILDWTQVYEQLERGDMSSQLRQISANRFQIFQEILNRRLVQHGNAPDGRLCIAILVDKGRIPVVQGMEIGANSVVLLRGGEEFLLHAPKGMNLLAVSLDSDRFEQLAELNLSAEQHKLLETASQIDVPGELHRRIQNQISDVFEYLLALPEADNRDALEKVFEDMIIEAFLDLFSNSMETSRSKRRNYAVCAYLVKRSRELALDRANVPTSVIGLCQDLGVSRRTLQNSFQTVTGTRPVEYLRNLRLNGVRRKLINTSADDVKVGDVAADFGFQHLSHFATYYCELFGELPSDTPRADG
ncbi:MAG: helix-turn-helix domain-containing protein [Acidihalobacter sp.]